MSCSFFDLINTKLDGLFFLSESEEPVELLQWPEVCTIAAAEQKIVEAEGAEPHTLTVQSVAEFLAPIQKMAVPEDPQMQEYAQRWMELLQEFQKQACIVQVILSPVIEAQQQIYIVGFTENGALALHTAAVVT